MLKGSLLNTIRGAVLSPLPVVPANGYNERQGHLGEDYCMYLITKKQNIIVCTL